MTQCNATEDEESLELVCETLTHFEEDSFKNGDPTRSEIIIPSQLFDEKDWLTEYGYVHAIAGGGSNQESVITQVSDFSEEHNSEEYMIDGFHRACVRSALQERIGVRENESGQRIELTEYKSPSVDGLNVERVQNTEQQGLDIVTKGSFCYIHDSVKKNLEISDNDKIEVLNPKTGARICLPVKTGDNRHYRENWIRLDRNSRKLIGVEADQRDKSSGADHVTVRVPADITRRGQINQWWGRLTEWIGRGFVDYSTVRLQIKPGRDRDEDRNIVRIAENTMKSLGVQEHDKVVLQWNNRRQTARCLEDIEERGTEALGVRVPSTERDKLEVSVGDCIDVRRDMHYAAGKQVAFSVLGILAILINADTLLNLLNPVITVSVLAGISVIVLYLVMLPKRQQCQS